jgi:hypothetical protein
LRSGNRGKAGTRCAEVRAFPSGLNTIIFVPPAIEKPLL